MDAYTGGFNVKSAWMMFLLATVVLLMLFLNMLIAVMSEPFEDVKENKDAYVLRKKVSFIVTYLDLIDLKKEFGKNKYIMIVKPEDIEEDQEKTEHQLFEQALQKSNEIYRHQVLLRDDILERLGTIERNMYQPPEDEPLPKEEPVIQPKPKVVPVMTDFQKKMMPAPKEVVQDVLKPKAPGEKLFANPVVR